MLDWIGIHLPSISEWLEIVRPFYATWGYPVVLLAAALENTIFVTWLLPGGTMVLLGGVYSRLGPLELPWVVLLGWVGTFCGASIDYLLGRLGNRPRVYAVLRRAELSAPLGRAGSMLARYGFFAFLAGHFIGQLRSLVAVAAGLTGMPYWRFALYEAPAALAWAGVYGAGGYLLADQLGAFEQFMERFGWAAAVAIGLFMFWKFWLPRADTPELLRKDLAEERVGDGLGTGIDGRPTSHSGQKR